MFFNIRFKMALQYSSSFKQSNFSMDYFLNFPCKDCSNTCPIKVPLDINYIFQSLLKESILLAKNASHNLFPNYSVMNNVEKNMYCSLSRMLTSFFQNHPEKIKVVLKNYNNLYDIYPIFKQKLQDGMKLGESPTLRRQLSRAGILSMPYQCIVLESLIVAGKLAVMCMNQFQNEDEEIFKNILNTLLDFFEETHITKWILHVSYVMHPFGTVGCIQQQEI